MVCLTRLFYTVSLEQVFEALRSSRTYASKVEGCRDLICEAFEARERFESWIVDQFSMLRVLNSIHVKNDQFGIVDLGLQGVGRFKAYGNGIKIYNAQEMQKFLRHKSELWLTSAKPSDDILLRPGYQDGEEVLYYHRPSGVTLGKSYLISELLCNDEFRLELDVGESWMDLIRNLMGFIQSVGFYLNEILLDRTQEGMELVDFKVDIALWNSHFVVSKFLPGDFRLWDRNEQRVVDLGSITSLKGFLQQYIAICDMLLAS
jgi:hypothetical protein